MHKCTMLDLYNNYIKCSRFRATSNFFVFLFYFDSLKIPLVVYEHCAKIAVKFTQEKLKVYAKHAFLNQPMRNQPFIG